jgi:hypothetical protein
LAAACAAETAAVAAETAAETLALMDISMTAAEHTHESTDRSECECRAGAGGLEGAQRTCIDDPTRL